ncbi:nucleic acid-binding protein [Methanomicrobium antiquum]|uniref:Nucleic acid-binding protein n=1 Tax=Methanomicrobium antiquum TaxID=487686 RepID=A0AAF0FL36_9EURY|nr:nucleic acid-binding protein [Methanomicrobium antiquum]MDD3976726.1 nucleic acid-binding protein [Methanomicrobium sp.]WFN36513.1 nucleic acid-binding protein [Methanomicrobium antiquum]
MTPERAEKNNQRKYIREPAKRIFASELRETRLQFKDGEDEKSPVYVMLPTGERCNRIFFCGQMTQKERKGDENPFYTARVTDPTGIFFINAGSYQQEAMLKISQIEAGAYVSVVGKPIVRETPDGSVFVSVRVENISETDIETTKIWVDDAAEATLNRLDKFGETDDSVKANEFYNTNKNVFRKMAYEALVRTEI